MPKFKNIRVKMKSGKSRLQRVKVLASGKYKFVKNPTKRVTRRSRKKSNPGRRRGVRRMARRKKKKGGKSTTRTLYKLLRMGAFAAPALVTATRADLNTSDKIKTVFADYTGYNLHTGEWHGHRLLHGWGAYIGACAATYGIPKAIGLLRRL